MMKLPILPCAEKLELVLSTATNLVAFSKFRHYEVFFQKHHTDEIFIHHNEGHTENNKTQKTCFIFMFYITSFKVETMRPCFYLVN